MVETATEEMWYDRDCGFWMIMMAKTNHGKDCRGRYKLMMRTKGRGRRNHQ